MDESLHEKTFCQPLQTNNKHFKIVVVFLTGYNGIFNVTIKNNSLHFATSFTGKDDFIQMSIPPGVYEFESFNEEIGSNNIEGHFTEKDYSFLGESNFSTLASIVDI